MELARAAHARLTSSPCAAMRCPRASTLKAIAAARPLYSLPHANHPALVVSTARCRSWSWFDLGLQQSNGVVATCVPDL